MARKRRRREIERMRVREREREVGRMDLQRLKLSKTPLHPVEVTVAKFRD